MEHAQAEDEGSVFRVLYCSRIPQFSDAAGVERDIEYILGESRRHNADHGITGVLVTNKRMYSQVLEGPKLAVKDLLGHIACDGRHQDIRIISSHRSERRVFEGWSMAFMRTNRDLETEAYLFPENDGHSNILAISAYCAAVRTHVLNGTNF